MVLYGSESAEAECKLSLECVSCFASYYFNTQNAIFSVSPFQGAHTQTDLWSFKIITIAWKSHLKSNEDEEREPHRSWEVTFIVTCDSGAEWTCKGFQRTLGIINEWVWGTLHIKKIQASYGKFIDSLSINCTYPNYFSTQETLVAMLLDSSGPQVWSL